MTGIVKAAIRVLARPTVSSARMGEIVLGIPALRLAGSHGGVFENPSAAPPIAGGDTRDGCQRVSPAGRSPGMETATRWMEVLFLLLPQVNRVAYDTAGARVVVSFDPDIGEPDSVQDGLEKVLDAAMDIAVELAGMDRQRREETRTALARSFAASPVDLSADAAADDLAARLREAIRR